MAEPDFIEDFDLKECTATPAEYRHFILRLRQRASSTRQSQGIPVLPNPPPAGNLPPFFEVRLHTGGVANQILRLRILTHNLYIIGYRAEHVRQWNEITNRENRLSSNPRHLINDSIFCPEDVNYDILERRGGEIEGLGLNQQRLNQAIINILGNDNAKRANALLVIVQMISESMRFVPVLDGIVREYSASTGYSPDGNIIFLEKHWGKLSQAVREHDNNPQASTRLNLPHIFAHITTISHLVSVIAILLFQQHNRGGSGSRLLRAVDMETTAGEALEPPDGRALAEVFSVCILDIDNESPGDLYGTITATDGLQSYYIYNRDKGNSQSISVRDYATLTGPSRALSAADYFIIDVNLKDHDSISFDDEISKGKIKWNAYDYTSVWDKVQTTDIKGEYGSAQLRYAVMSNAAEALVDVVLINGDDENPAGVYGKIYAMNTSFNDEIELFRKSDETPEQVYPKASIPLLRPAVVVPMDASLKIRVDLWDYDKLSPNDKIARGTVEFKPDIYHSVYKRIKGEYGEVEVRVRWL